MAILVGVIEMHKLCYNSGRYLHGVCGAKRNVKCSYDTNFVLLKLKFITRTSYKIRSTSYTRTHAFSKCYSFFFHLIAIIVTRRIIS